jgi:hypothetical protein
LEAWEELDFLAVNRWLLDINRTDTVGTDWPWTVIAVIGAIAKVNIVPNDQSTNSSLVNRNVLDFKKINYWNPR